MDAAEGQERKERELPGQLGQHRGNHRRIIHRAIATEIGARAASTHSSGRRSKAIAMKVSAHMTMCQGMPLSGRAIFKPVAMMRPVAAAETPLVAPRTAARSANLA